MANGGLLGQVRELKTTVEEQKKTIDEQGREITLLKEQVSGDRGLTEAVKELAGQLAAFRKLAWGVMVVIVGACVTAIFGLPAGPV